ncbi:MAG: hypothetical protein M0P00_10155 [Bacteroidaceae bacterium]|nr:hypothetical protein [Bacteroidaceae bacterium]
MSPLTQSNGLTALSTVSACFFVQVLLAQIDYQENKIQILYFSLIHTI